MFDSPWHFAITIAFAAFAIWAVGWMQRHFRK